MNRPASQRHGSRVAQREGGHPPRQALARGGAFPLAGRIMVSSSRRRRAAHPAPFPSPPPLSPSRRATISPPRREINIAVPRYFPPPNVQSPTHSCPVFLVAQRLPRNGTKLTCRPFFLLCIRASSRMLHTQGTRQTQPYLEHVHRFTTADLALPEPPPQPSLSSSFSSSPFPSRPPHIRRSTLFPSPW